MKILFDNILKLNFILGGRYRQHFKIEFHFWKMGIGSILKLNFIFENRTPAVASTQTNENFAQTIGSFPTNPALLFENPSLVIA